MVEEGTTTTEKETGATYAPAPWGPYRFQVLRSHRRPRVAVDRKRPTAHKSLTDGEILGHLMLALAPEWCQEFATCCSGRPAHSLEGNLKCTS